MTRRKRRIGAYGLTGQELDTLATYNAEVWRGVQHDEAYARRMAELQKRFNAALAKANAQEVL